MVEGCLAACERLRAKTQDGDAGPKDTFLPLFEALNWAASIDMFYVDAGRPLDDDLLKALRYARNSVHHQWGLALRRRERLHPTPLVITNRPGGSGPRGPSVVWWWSWVSLEELPKSDDHPPRYGEDDAYERCLADKPAEETLQALKPVLDALV
jgi:hypothetical protein